MNIFYLHRDPMMAAKYHCDRHVVKMILETAQILSAVHYRYGLTAPYRETHKNHPSTRWAGDTWHNYVWLWSLGMELCFEYTRRYKRRHKCQDLLENELKFAPKGIPTGVFSDPPQCMPDECKKEDTVEGYRNYYRMKKKEMAVWKYSEKPEWMSLTDETSMVETS